MIYCISASSLSRDFISLFSAFSPQAASRGRSGCWMEPEEMNSCRIQSSAELSSTMQTSQRSKLCRFSDWNRTVVTAEWQLSQVTFGCGLTWRSIPLAICSWLRESSSGTADFCGSTGTSSARPGGANHCSCPVSKWVNITLSALMSVPNQAASSLAQLVADPNQAASL